MNTDFLNDKTGAILNYAFDNELLPEFVKEASMDEIQDVQDLNDKAFADQVNRLFPCHTKEATVLSALYIAANHEQDEEVLNNLNKVASVFEVSDEVNNIFNHFNEAFEKVASDNTEEFIEKYALYLEDDENTKGYYNISTKEDTLLSIKHLHEDFMAGGVQPHHMRKLACVVNQAAKDFNIVPEYIPSVITKYATAKMPDANVAYQLIELRDNGRVDMNRYKEVIVKMANDLADSDMELDTMQTIADNAAEQLYCLDEEYNIKYASDQPNPYEVIYNGPTIEHIEKFAAEHVYISDIPVPVVDIINLSEDQVNNIFSKKAAETIINVKNELKGSSSVEKSAAAHEKLNELSEDVRSILLKTLASTGW